MKYWNQDSPTTPCAPYHIDCINPLRVEDEVIERLIITEGEKDVLSLLEAGYRYVISVPNGASCVPSKAFEACEEGLAPVNDVVLCGDPDLPGRTLMKKLADYFGCTPDDLLSEEKQKPVLPDGLPDDVAEVVMRYLAAPPAQKQLVLQALRALEQVQLSQDLADD